MTPKHRKLLTFLLMGLTEPRSDFGWWFYWTSFDLFEAAELPPLSHQELYDFLTEELNRNEFTYYGDKIDDLRTSFWLAYQHKITRL